MVMEAMRLSLLEHEEQQRKEAEKKRKEEEAVKNSKPNVQNSASEPPSELPIAATSSSGMSGVAWGRAESCW